MTSAQRRLSFSAGGVSVTVDEARVTSFGYAGALTPVPGSDGAVEGLADIDGRPVVQIDLARALGGPAGTGGKRAVVSMPAGEVALRIQDVAVVKDGEGGGSLDIQALQPWTACPSWSGQIPAEAGPASKPDDRFEPGVPVLIVEAGGETTGLLVSGGERVEAARAVLDAGTGGGLVVAIGDQLLAGRRLGSTREAGDRDGAWAVVVPRRDGGVFALVVDRVVKLTEIHPARLFPIDNANGGRAIWYAEADVVLPVLSVGAACGDAPDPLPPGGAPQRSPAVCPKHVAAIRPGVRADCGGIAVVLPFETVNRALDSSLQILDRRPRGQGRAALPVLDAAALLGPSGSRRHGRWLAVQTCDGELILTVNALRLEPHSDGPAWRSLPAMPPASVALFDALRQDAAGGWIYRLRSPLRYSAFPWSLRRALARATAGWVRRSELLAE
jgi:chemotaxis signal transduction protein